METKIQVLVVEDDIAMQRLVAKWLTNAGYDVSCVRNGRDAMTMIESCCPSIVLTDWDMPEIDGLTLCKWIRSQDLSRYVYTIMTTVRTGTPDVIRCLESGADDFLRKPIDRGELRARMMAGVRVGELEKRLNEAAKLDTLTGLASQRLFHERMQVEWSRSSRYRLPLSCVMVDIDGFKAVNERHGHSVGDVVIRTVADTLRENSRDVDLIGRFGGEEFSALLPETDEFHAAAWAERVRRAIARRSITMNGQELQITASFGVAQRLADTESPASLVDLAFQAMMVAKRSGRDRVISYSDLHSSNGIGREEYAGEIMASVPASQVMANVVAGLSQDSPISRAAHYFLRFGVQSAPVLDQDGQLAGVLSESDAMAVMLGPNWRSTPIREVMKRNLVTFEEESPAIDVYEFLCRVSIPNAIIVRDNRPTGVISRTSILRWLASCLSVGIAPNANPDVLDRKEIGTSAAAGEKVRATLGALDAEISSLQGRLDDANQATAPGIEFGASRMQELIDELLACSRQMGGSDPCEEDVLIAPGGSSA